MAEKYQEFLERDINNIEACLHEYVRKSPRFYVHEQMQQAYLTFCDKAKQAFERAADSLLGMLGKVEEFQVFDETTNALQTELNEVKLLLKGKNSNTEMEDSYKAIQEVGALRMKLNKFIESFKTENQLKKMPSICFDTKSIDKIIFIDEESDYGTYGSKELVFDRFSELKLKQNWTVGPGRIDAIRFQFKRPVKLTGFKCFDNKNADQYGLKYTVFVNGKQIIDKHEEDIPQSTDPSHQSLIRFKKALELHKQDSVDIAIEYTNYGDTYCCRGQGYRAGPEKGKNDFILIEKSELDQNCTKHDIGQIPGVSYLLVD